MVDYIKSSVDVPFYTLLKTWVWELSTSSKETESIFLKGQLNKKKLNKYKQTKYFNMIGCRLCLIIWYQKSVCHHVYQKTWSGRE